MIKRIAFTGLLGIITLLGCHEQQPTVKWVCSTEADAWVQKEDILLNEVKESDTIKADIEILLDEKQQVIDGFGGCFNEKGWEALSVLEENVREEILKGLFDTVDGLKFNICRMPIGANDFALEYYSLNDSAGDYEMKHFSIERDKKYLIPYIKAAKKYNPGLKIWASPWCPPAWMKVNQHYACRKTENNDLVIEGKQNTDLFIADDKTSKAYALYFSKFLKAYKKEGIDVYAIHVQNEPHACQDFPSCTWTSPQLRDFIKNYLAPQLKKENPETEIWLGTINWPDTEQIDTIFEDKNCHDAITGVGLQYAGVNTIAEVYEKYPDKKIMQTESRCWKGENTWDDAYNTFRLMKYYFNNGANSYLYWNTILDETGLSTWKWKQNAMVTINKQTKAVTYNHEYYLMKHFSHFIKSGSYRLKINDEEKDALVFNNGGQVIVIVASPSEEDENISIKTGEKIFQVKLPARSFNTFSLTI